MRANTASRSRPGDIERHEDRGVERLGQRLDVRLGLVGRVGDGEVGTDLAECAGAAVGDRVLVGDSADERLLALENLARLGVGHRGHAKFLVSVGAGVSRGRRWRAMRTSIRRGVRAPPEARRRRARGRFSGAGSA
jgi:hypothetical protein